MIKNQGIVSRGICGQFKSLTVTSQIPSGVKKSLIKDHIRVEEIKYMQQKNKIPYNKQDLMFTT